MRPVAAYLVVIAVLVAAMWLAEEVGALLRGTVPPTVLQFEAPTNIVHVFDLAVVLPAMALAALMLLRDRPWGYVLAGMMLVKATSIGLWVVAMIWFSARRGFGAPARVHRVLRVADRRRGHAELALLERAHARPGRRAAARSSHPHPSDDTSMTTAAATARPPGAWARIRPWIDLQELPKHLANVLPFLLGTTIAYWQSGRIDWLVFGVALLALFLLTDGTYIANEYFDYENDKLNVGRIGGADAVGVTTTGGTRVLVKGLIARRHALIAAVIAFLLAIPVGLFLRFGLDTGPLTIPLGLLARLHRLVLYRSAHQGVLPRLGRGIHRGGAGARGVRRVLRAAGLQHASVGRVLAVVHCAAGSQDHP